MDNKLNWICRTWTLTMLNHRRFRFPSTRLEGIFWRLWSSGSPCTKRMRWRKTMEREIHLKSPKKTRISWRFVVSHWTVTCCIAHFQSLELNHIPSGDEWTNDARNHERSPELGYQGTARSGSQDVSQHYQCLQWCAWAESEVWHHNRFDSGGWRED